jgi:hypothetical protein
MALFVPAQRHPPKQRLNKSTKEQVFMDQQKVERIRKRMAEVEFLIAETKKRLPAHSIKPPVMLDLLEYEDEYDLLLEKLNKLKKVHDER